MINHARSGRPAASLAVFRRVLAAHPPGRRARSSLTPRFSSAAAPACATRYTRRHASAGLAASNPVLACFLLAVDCAARSDLQVVASLFDGMTHRDAVSYTALMSALLRAGAWNQALALYPRIFTSTALLAPCASRGLCRHGRMLDAQLLRWGVALVDMYSSCGFMDHAHAVLRSTPEANVVLWTAMIAVSSQTEDLQAALWMFRQMELAAVPHNAFTFAGTITACASSAQPPGVPNWTAALHARVLKFTGTMLGLNCK